jgi:uncharacterized membrane protein
MNRHVASGLAVLAGAALFEAALIPGVVIGGAAILAPRYLPRLRRGVQSVAEGIQAAAGGIRPAADSAIRRGGAAATKAAPGAQAGGARDLVGCPGIKRAVAKTITFRVIVTALDFTTNMVVIGELSTAAGLSTFNLIAGPLFYLAHEGAWNYLGPAGDSPVDLAAMIGLRAAAETPADGGLVVSRALAKTVTFRTIASVMDFTVNYVVVRDIATAAGLSAFAFFVGPFVYLGHEKLWDYWSPSTDAIPPVGLLPAPARPATGG